MAKDLIAKTQKVGTTYTHILDLSERVDGLNTSVSTAVWSVVSGTSVTVAGGTADAVSSRATLTVVSTGKTHFRVTVTYADSEVSVIDYLVTGFEIG